MSASGVVVAADVLHVDGDEADGMRAVEEYRNVSLAGETGDFAGGKHVAGSGRDMAEGEELGAGGDGLVESVEKGCGVVGGEAQLVDDDAAPTSEVHPWQRTRGVFLIAYDDFVSGLPIDAGRYDVDALGNVAGERDFVLRRSEQARSVCARAFVNPLDLFHNFGRLRAVLLDEPCDTDGLVNHGRRLRAVAHVQVGAVLEGGDLAAYLVYIHVIFSTAASSKRSLGVGHSVFLLGRCAQDGHRPPQQTGARWGIVSHNTRRAGSQGQATLAHSLRTCLQTTPGRTARFRRPAGLLAQFWSLRGSNSTLHGYMFNGPEA